MSHGEMCHKVAVMAQYLLWIQYMCPFPPFVRLGLKDQQEREIVHVLMDCCLQEKAFNAFYAVLGEKLCSHDRRFQVCRACLSTAESHHRYIMSLSLELFISQGQIYPVYGHLCL